MELEVLTALESVPHSRRAFLAGTFGLAIALLLPAEVADAAARKQRSAAKRKAPKRGSQRQAQGRASRKAGRRGQAAHRLLAQRAEPLPSDGAALARSLDPEYRSLSLYHLHTGERLAIEYFVNGRYEPDCLRELSWVLRDHRTDDVHAIDPGVLDLLYAVRTQLESNDALQIVCGYRSPLTNLLKLLSGAGVAEHSYHLSGQAIDFYVPRRSLRAVHRVAVALHGGGVGYYPRSGFVHVDTGPVRYW